MPFSPKIIGNPILPAIHGGMTGAFLETTAIVGVTRELGVLAPPKPIGLTINYLRSGRALDSYAKVSIVKQGRRVVAFEAQAWQDDRTKPIAFDPFRRDFQQHFCALIQGGESCLIQLVHDVYAARRRSWRIRFPGPAATSHCERSGTRPYRLVPRPA